MHESHQIVSFELETLKNMDPISTLTHTPKRKNILRVQIGKPENHNYSIKFQR